MTARPESFEYPDEAGYPDGSGFLDEGTAGEGTESLNDVDDADGASRE
ncbi:hypothetical protein HII28_11700 [Planctomonas sp. JC2975]|nr:hypothetical protein [Planctomonas sp. JC2975]NNC12539.1 hypothetical protein [Planctomonas sp. JC2975]